MAKAIPIHWLKNASEDKRTEVEAIIRNSVVALSRLYDIIEEKESSINSAEVSQSDFENPSWAYKAAYRLGQKASFKEIKDLLAFIKG